MNGYEYSSKWFNFAFEKKECKCIHTAIYLWILELNNRLGWKNEFGLPTTDTLEGLSIGNKRTYLAALKEIESWGFIKIVKESKNQYQANIISICRSKKDTAKVTSLDTATLHSKGNSIAPIDKQINKQTNKLFIPPIIFEVQNYFTENGYTKEAGTKAFQYYDVAEWKDRDGKQVKNWKQKMQGVWFKDENKITAKKEDKYYNANTDSRRMQY